MKTEKQETGIHGEEIAAEYLIGKGYRILEKNWQCGHLEVDIIALTEKHLVIVEVKTRKSTTMGEPEEFVNLQKQRHLIKAAGIYIERTGITQEVRFDIISVVIKEGIESVKHLESAFKPRW